MKTVSQIDAEGYLVGFTIADESPLEKDVFLLPAGCVDVPPVDVPAGKRARFDGVGFVLEDVPPDPQEIPPTHAELVAQTLARARGARLPILSILDGLQASALTTGDTARATAIEAAKQGLRDITKTDLSACTTAEEMQAAIYAAYLAIAQAAPVEVKTAFAQVVSA